LNIEVGEELAGRMIGGWLGAGVMNLDEGTPSSGRSASDADAGEQRKRGGRAYDLEDRLLRYAVRIVRLVEALPPTRAGNHLGGQLLRSGTSPLLNHGEAQGAESPDDFVHKLKICLKELRESYRNLRLIRAIPLIRPPAKLDPLLQETHELICIFVTSINTSRRRAARAKASA
jgi:four helix bundle protein